MTSGIRLLGHQYHDQVRQFRKALMALGMAPQSKVAVLGFNQIEWVIAGIGMQYVGNVRLVFSLRALKKKFVTWLITRTPKSWW